MTPARRRVRYPVALFACLLAAASGPAWGADVGFTPNPAFVCDSATVDVTIDASVTDLRGFTFVFEFDPAVVVPIAVTAGPLVTGAGCGNFFTWVNMTAIGDSIYVDGATLGCSVDGPGSIIRLRFVKLVHGATSPLVCRSGSMRDSNNQSIPHTCNAGALETCPAIGVEARPWVGVKRLYH